MKEVCVRVSGDFTLSAELSRLAQILNWEWFVLGCSNKCSIRNVNRVCGAGGTDRDLGGWGGGGGKGIGGNSWAETFLGFFSHMKSFA